MAETVRGFTGLALDFETANGRQESACAVGVAGIVEGVVVGSRSWLIRPPVMEFSPFNISIHGITPRDVADAPTFPIIWETLLPLISGGLVFAHNAAFDMGVLRAVLRTYDLPLPEFSHICTVKVARRFWPDLPNHKLSTVADYLDIPLNHHDAESDAHAAAEIACRAAQRGGGAAVLGLAKAFGEKPKR